MIRIGVWTNDDEQRKPTMFDYKKPRRYMLSWSFEQLLDYLKEELADHDIKEEDVIVVHFENDREKWEYNVKKEFSNKELEKYNTNLAVDVLENYMSDILSMLNEDWLTDTKLGIEKDAFFSCLKAVKQLTNNDYVVNELGTEWNKAYKSCKRV